MASVISSPPSSATPLNFFRMLQTMLKRQPFTIISNKKPSFGTLLPLPLHLRLILMLLRILKPSFCPKKKDLKGGLN